MIGEPKLKRETAIYPHLWKGRILLVNSRIHKSRCKVKYDNGWGGYEVRWVYTSTIIIILFHKKQDFPSHRLQASFPNLHEIHDEINIITQLEFSLQTTSTPPHPHPPLHALPAYKFIWVFFSLFWYFINYSEQFCRTSLYEYEGLNFWG